ncbi:MAG: hypothetical protein WA051_02535 [Minisyncoccia bacterium]
MSKVSDLIAMEKEYFSWRQTHGAEVVGLQLEKYVALMNLVFDAFGVDTDEQDLSDIDPHTELPDSVSTDLVRFLDEIRK